GVALVGHDDHVVLASQAAGLDVILVDEIVGNLPSIEGQPHPAYLLGVRPGGVDGEAREVDVHGFHVGDRADGRGGQPERLHFTADTIVRPGDDERAGGDRRLSDLELLAGRTDGDVAEAVAKRDQVQRAGVVDDE